MGKKKTISTKKEVPAQKQETKKIIVKIPAIRVQREKIKKIIDSVNKHKMKGNKILRDTRDGATIQEVENAIMKLSGVESEDVKEYYKKILEEIKRSLKNGAG